jgi:phosphoribosylamine---glycine ligase
VTRVPASKDDRSANRDADSKILVVDVTGRGHAICELFIRTNPGVTVYYGPGCDLIEDERIIPVPAISVTDVRTVIGFLASHPVEFVLVSHIDALARGYVDDLRQAGYRVIGPTADAAALESSKRRGKQFCLDHGIPVPEFRAFGQAEAAKAYIRGWPYPCVVKVDSLTPDGDGAMVCDTAAEAEAAVDRFADELGDSLRLIVEERLTGQEVSVFALLDGDGAAMFPCAMDYKRTLEGDAGKNCDGMGSIAPHPADTPELRGQLRATLVDPLVRGMRADGLDFTGFVFLGAILTDHGPVVIEINARFGDSEAEVVLPGVRSDFLAMCRAVLTRTVRHQRVVTDGLARCSVALVQGCLDPFDADALAGWPFGKYATGQPVDGLAAADPRDVTMFYANLRRGPAGRPNTCGGRVLHVVGQGHSLEQARERAYRQVRHVRFPGMRYRSDIGAPGTLGGPAAGPASDDGEREPAVSIGRD